LNEVDTRHRLLVVDNQWIGIENPGSFVLDIASLEDSVHIQKNSTLSSAELTQLIEAAHQYRGSLLEGYYQDWCLIARERYLGLYLMIQDRLMRHYTKTNQYGLGINCGYSILEHDAARERTCRGLMRLYYLAGDRSGAIRQFQYCVNVLQKELAVKPSHKTLRLFALIQEGLPLSAEDTAPPVSPQFLDLLTQLNRLEKTIHSVRAQLHNIQSC
jgi:DNA-binding SARP family transcriptional activator